VATTPVLPDWLDQVPVNYEPEKELVAEVEKMAEQNGWTVSNGESLPSELRQRTDVLFEQSKPKRNIRLAILPKGRRGIGMIRLDASNLRTVELVYQPRKKRWRVEAGGVFIEDDLLKHDWDWLIERLFR
jgi:hypothetical protein